MLIVSSTWLYTDSVCVATDPSITMGYYLMINTIACSQWLELMYFQRRLVDKSNNEADLGTLPN